jgi:hypothetical protein
MLENVRTDPMMLLKTSGSTDNVKVQIGLDKDNGEDGIRVHISNPSGRQVSIQGQKYLEEQSATSKSRIIPLPFMDDLFTPIEFVIVVIVLLGLRFLFLAPFTLQQILLIILKFQSNVILISFPMQVLILLNPLTWCIRPVTYIVMIPLWLLLEIINLLNPVYLLFGIGYVFLNMVTWLVFVLLLFVWFIIFVIIY